MSVEVKYIVKRKGIEVMSSISQKEANAYDKMLDISDELMNFLGLKVKEVVGLDISENKMEELFIFMASNKEDLSKLLRGQKLTSKETEIKNKDTSLKMSSVK